jgi:hypothetical protein
MHVDGGVVAQTFLYPTGMRTEELSRIAPRERNAYVIRNSRLRGDGTDANRNLLSIAGRAISSMIQYSGQNDIIRLQNLTRRDGVRFNLAYIRDDFGTPWRSAFDPAYMRALYEYGRTRMLEGRAWESSHPSLRQADPGAPVPARPSGGVR